MNVCAYALDDARAVMVYICTVRRTQIYLTREEAAALARVAGATGRTRSDLIREAIDRAFLGKGAADPEAALRDSFGAWKARRTSGAAYVERLRSGRRLAGSHE